jgi:hypothetical protein
MLVWISETVRPGATVARSQIWRATAAEVKVASITPDEPERASSCHGMTGLLQQVHVQITPRRPARTGDMPQPCGRVLSSFMVAFLFDRRFASPTSRTKPRGPPALTQIRKKFCTSSTVALCDGPDYRGSIQALDWLQPYLSSSFAKMALTSGLL